MKRVLYKILYCVGSEVSAAALTLLIIFIYLILMSIILFMCQQNSSMLFKFLDKICGQYHLYLITYSVANWRDGFLLLS